MANVDTVDAQPDNGGDSIDARFAGYVELDKDTDKELDVSGVRVKW